MMTKAEMTVARTILEQLGKRMMMMLGANRVTGTHNGVRFSIGRNSKGVNAIQITLNPLDLYDLSFLRVRKTTVTTLTTVRDVYVDQMHAVIESETGMYTQL